MEAFAPEDSVGSQKIPNLVAAKVEDQSAPILVGAFARILMFVERGAVKIRQCPIIAREVCRDPIYNYPEASLVEGVYKELKIIRRSVAAGAGKKARHLVTPGRIIGML